MKQAVADDDKFVKMEEQLRTVFSLLQKQQVESFVFVVLKTDGEMMTVWSDEKIEESFYKRIDLTYTAQQAMRRLLSQTMGKPDA